MGGFQTPNVTGQGGIAGTGGLLGFLTQGLQGYEAAHKEKLGEKEEKEQEREKKAESEANVQHEGLENKVLQAGLDQQAQTTKIANAQTTWDNITKQLVPHPELARDPSIMAGLTNAANILNKPLVKNKDGTLNVDSIMPRQFSDLTEQQIAYYQGLAPDVRKNQMKDIGGIPDDFLKSHQYHTFDQDTQRINAVAKQTSATARQAGEKHREYIDDKKLPVWMRLNNAKAALTEAITKDERQKVQASIQEIYANIGRINAEASAIPARLGIAQGNLDMRMGELRVAQQRLQYDTSPSSMQNLNKIATTLDSQADSAERDLDNANRTLEAYAASKSDNNGIIGPDDNIGQELQNRVNSLEQVVINARNASSQARSNLTSHVPQGRAITQHSGKQTTILPRKSNTSGLQEGQRGNSKSGKPIIVRNGKWEYVSGS